MIRRCGFLRSLGGTVLSATLLLGGFVSTARAVTPVALAPAAAGPSMSTVSVDIDVLTDLANQRRESVLENIPLPGNQLASFRVEPIEVFGPNAKFYTYDGITRRPIPRPNLAVYSGTDVEPENQRDIVFSIVDGRTLWAVVRQKGQLLALIQPQDSNNSTVHRLLAANDLSAPQHNLCEGKIDPHKGAPPSAPAAASQPRVGDPPLPTLIAEVLVDIAYDLYSTSFASDSAAASAYAANVFGAVSSIYRRDLNVGLVIAELVIWTAPDPFSGSDTGQQLSNYVSWSQLNRGSHPRDISHLLAHAGGGGIAYLDVLCGTTYGYGVSNIDGTLSSFPTSGNYVWDIEVVAHEVGHNFGSNHTHCYNPPLDHCYNQEAGCYSGPVESAVGEIMSYCHLINSIDLHFSSTVGTVMRSRAESASCLSIDSLCGNGVVDPGEACDDGNTLAGDCCAVNCVAEEYTACVSDDDPCTSDVCSAAGVCSHVPPGTCSACGTPTILPAAGGSFNGTFPASSTIRGSCSGDGPEVVYQWTPDLSGTATVSTCGGTGDTVLYVRKDQCDFGQQLACNDDACSLQSTITFSSTAGTTYFLAVDAYSNSAANQSFAFTVTPGTCGNGTVESGESCDDGNFVDGDCCSASCTAESGACTDDGDPCTTDVCVAGSCGHPPPGTCNACNYPIDIPAVGGTFAGTTVGPSTLTGCTNSLGSEHVYRWVPAASGVANFSTCSGSNYDTVLYVRSEDCQSSLACNDDSCGNRSSVSMAVSEGTTYLIVVDGFAGNGNYTLTVSPPVVCGDTIVTGSEECDDGNLDSGDGCTNECTLCGNGARSGTEECDDGNLVDTDSCSSACKLRCADSPIGGCRRPVVAGKSSLLLKAGSSDSKDSLVWKWGRGPTTPKSDFGNPLASDNQMLCIYDQSGLMLSAMAPAGGQCGSKDCWTEKSAGFKYVDKELTPGGLAKIDLKQGLSSGKAKISIKGAGSFLHLPDTATLASPVTVQLTRPGGTCFEAVYSSPFSKQSSIVFKDVSD